MRNYTGHGVIVPTVSVPAAKKKGALVLRLKDYSF